MSKNTVSGTLFNCHKFARWSHVVLKFHFMKLTLPPPCLQCCLPEIVLEVDFICCFHFIEDMFIYTYTDFGLNSLKKIN